MNERPRQVRVIALLNQKGGVGKTTSTVNLGAALARLGLPTLLVDLDPQAHLTLHVGIDPNAPALSIYDLMTDDTVTVDQVVREVSADLAVLPAHRNLAGIEAELAPKMVTGAAQRVLRGRCDPLLSPAPGEAPPYEYILIDCPPSLGLLTINALTLAREVLVPMQSHFLALQGLSQLLDTVRLIKQAFNPDLLVTGMLLCMHENQTLLAQEVLADLQTFLEQGRGHDAPWRDARVLEPAVRRNIKLAECPSFGKTIFDYEPGCHGASDYRRAAVALIEHGAVLGLCSPLPDGVKAMETAGASEAECEPPETDLEATEPIDATSAEEPAPADDGPASPPDTPGPPPSADRTDATAPDGGPPAPAAVTPPGPRRWEPPAIPLPAVAGSRADAPKSADAAPAHRPEPSPPQWTPPAIPLPAVGPPHPVERPARTAGTPSSAGQWAPPSIPLPPTTTTHAGAQGPASIALPAAPTAPWGPPALPIPAALPPESAPDEAAPLAEPPPADDADASSPARPPDAGPTVRLADDAREPFID